MMEKLDKFLKPGRYIGGEVNAVIKDESEVVLRVALAFPEVYEIGMSHLGLKILYGMVNERPEFWAERVMAPWVDREEALRRENRPLTSLESGRPLADFDLIGFSLQYELTYTNILNMLDLAGLPLLARERGPEAPLVVGGGPCAFSPEPLADFFDFFYLGDAEAGFMEILDQVSAWKTAGGSKLELLKDLAGAGQIDELARRLPMKPDEQFTQEQLDRAAKDFASLFYGLVLKEMQKTVEYDEEEDTPISEGVRDLMTLELPKALAGQHNDPLAGYIREQLGARLGEAINEQT